MQSSSTQCTHWHLHCLNSTVFGNLFPVGMHVVCNTRNKWLREREWGRAPKRLDSSYWLLQTVIQSSRQQMYSVLKSLTDLRGRDDTRYSCYRRTWRTPGVTTQRNLSTTIRNMHCVQRTVTLVGIYPSVSSFVFLHNCNSFLLQFFRLLLPPFVQGFFLLNFT